MSNRSFLAQKIFETRKSKGITQEELADQAGVTVRTIQRLENGESTPRAFTLKAIATALELDFPTLMANGTAGSDLVQSEESLTAKESPFRDTMSATDGNSVPVNDDEPEAYFMRLLILSCFSFIVLPYVHFLIPMRILKNRKRLTTENLHLAKRTIITQVYWVVAVNVLLLLTLVANLLLAKSAPGQQISYLLVAGIMYAINGIILLVTLGKSAQTDASLSTVRL